MVRTALRCPPFQLSRGVFVLFRKSHIEKDLPSLQCSPISAIFLSVFLSHNNNSSTSLYLFKLNINAICLSVWIVGDLADDTLGRWRHLVAADDFRFCFLVSRGGANLPATTRFLSLGFRFAGRTQFSCVVVGQNEWWCHCSSQASGLLLIFIQGANRARVSQTRFAII